MQLAQVNIARLREPLHSPRLRGFVAALDRINALAEDAPGFVWRLQTEDGDATAVRAFDDDMLIINMSVWTSVEALADYVYRSDHAAVMRQRRKWFHQAQEAYSALWWVADGHRPTPADARDRLAHLEAHGPTRHAFTFRTPYPPPGAESVPGPSVDTDCSI